MQIKKLFNPYYRVFSKYGIRKELGSLHSTFTFRNFELREKCIFRYSFAVPDNKSLEIIKKYSPIIELGAGTGYWSFLLKQIGTDIIAFDKKEKKWGWKKRWFRVKKGTYEVLPNYKDRTLLLCWPNYSSDFAYKSILNFKGKHFIYIGESSGGCTGDDNFFKYLQKNFNLIEKYKIPQWIGIHDFLAVYERI